MEHWIKPRACVVCGRTFSLSGHGTEEAKVAALHLTNRTLDPAALPPLISRCPSCYSGTTAPVGPAGLRQPSTMTAAREQQAVAAALALGEQMRTQVDDQVLYYARNVGGAVAVLSLTGIALVIAYSRLKQGFNPVFWVILLLLVGIAGAWIGLWAQRKRS